MNANSNQSNPYAPPTANVEDTRDEMDTELADRGTRLGAVLLDSLVIFLVVYLPVLIAIGSDVIRIAANPMAIGEILPRLGVAGLISLAGLIALITVTIVFVKRNGQTIGKRVLGIKVVRSDGSSVSLGRIFWMRNMIGWVISVVPRIGGLYGLVDALLIFSGNRQCLHDKIADTIVIKVQS